MAKRFVDTSKYKKPFVRSLPGPYKLLWDFLCLDCDHAGIWIVDFEIAQAYIGVDMPVNKADALAFFNKDEMRIVEIGGGKKWFIPSFIEFQYGFLSEKNRAHISVISILRRLNLLNEDLSIKINKPLTSPLQGVKDKELDKDKEKDVDFGKSENLLHSDSPIGGMVRQFTDQNEGYFLDAEKDFAALREVSEKIHKWLKLPGRYDNPENEDCIRLRWGELIIHVKADSHFAKYSLQQINKHFSSIAQSFSNGRGQSHKPVLTPVKGTSQSRTDALKNWGVTGGEQVP